MLGTLIPFIQGFGASNFHIWWGEIWGGGLNNYAIYCILVSYGMLCHCANFSNDSPYE